MDKRKAGYVVGEVDTGSFIFVSDLEAFPPRLEYLVIPQVKERTGDTFANVDVLAQVTRIVNYSDILGEKLSLHELETIISRYSGNTKVYGEATILGYLSEQGEIRMPRSASVPGQPVYVAPTDMLEQFFTRNIRAGIPVGGLITRDDVQVVLDPNGFRRHVAIIAQTGAGKSYLVGLILEQMLPLGATIIVFDPNSDYVMMRRDPNGNPTLIAEDVAIYRPPGVKGRRFNDDEIGGAENYTVDFSKLEPEEIFGIAGISENWVHIQKAVNDALEALDGIYGPEQLVAQLEVQANTKGREGVNSANALQHIRRLLSYRIWGQKNIPLDDLVRPRRISVIDLAGLQKRVSEYIVNKTLNEVWNKAVTGELEFPVFIVLEEAHSFAPAQGVGNASSSRTIERIAAEGRKFGIFLTVVTQRPNKIKRARNIWMIWKE